MTQSFLVVREFKHFSARVILFTMSAVFGSLQLSTSVFQKDNFLKVSNFAITANLEMDIVILAVRMFTNNLSKFMCT